LFRHCHMSARLRLSRPRLLWCLHVWVVTYLLCLFECACLIACLCLCYHIEHLRAWGNTARSRRDETWYAILECEMQDGSRCHFLLFTSRLIQKKPWNPYTLNFRLNKVNLFDCRRMPPFAHHQLQFAGLPVSKMLAWTLIERVV